MTAATEHVAPTVLIVEDEPIVALDLQHSLVDMGYDAFAIAASADEALRYAAKQRPDVVLMDIRIGGYQDGIEAASMLQKLFPVIIIYLTAHADIAMIDRAKQTAPKGYLVKPVKNSELRSTIEIALHNRELEREREKRRISDARLNMISDNIPIAVAYFDRNGRVQFANHVFRDLVPYRDNPIDATAFNFLGETLFQKSYPFRQKALRGEASGFVIELKPHDELRQYEVSYLPDMDACGEAVGVYAICVDVTERERINHELHQAHGDLKTILDAVPASITSWHLDLSNRFANAGARAQFATLRHHGAGKSMSDVMGERRYTDARPHIERALAGHASSYEQAESDEQGSMRYTHDHYIPECESDQVVGLYALAFDVTDLRQSHDKIRRLAQALETIREEERCAVATVLHDGIAQDLFALKLGLDHLETTTESANVAPLVYQELRDMVAKCMDDTRQIANELRPTISIHDGVTAAIRAHAEFFAKQAKLEITVEGSADMATLPQDKQLLLFRGVQELLTNVARHGKATSVTISLAADVNRILVGVADNGVGISDQDLKKSHSLGLLSLRERFTAMGGALEIERGASRGTLVTMAFWQKNGLEISAWQLAGAHRPARSVEEP